jgi:hypothetical protein
LISKSKTRRTAIRLGFRSGLEAIVSKQIEDAGIELRYETERINYTIPAREAKYTPDFKLPKPGGFFFVETKGIWTVQDRAKHVLIKKQHPEIDIRFVFSNQNAKLYKGSPTTYAMYCEKHGFRYASKVIPDDWLEEAKSQSQFGLK